VIGRTLEYKKSPAHALISASSEALQIKQAGEESKQDYTDEASKFMHFGEMNLLEGDVSFLFESRCEGSVTIPPIQIKPWHENVFEDKEFDIGKNLAIGWEHQGFDGLWIHSGWDFWNERSPATDLQYFIETDSQNEVQELKTIETVIKSCVIGSKVSLNQNDLLKNGMVTAAVRIPATGVDDLSEHTMDLVPWLAENYPESSFDRIRTDALLIYFCGRAALDERTDPNVGYWNQSRYILAIEPIN
jgi:hypothetical protein